MAVQKLIGPGAGARKYDLLTALAVAGLAGSPAFCMSMTRLIALITARYNWRLDEVSIGQSELARLWSVDLRTVKREIKRLRNHGILAVKRAGVRGRVSTYRLDYDQIDALTSGLWSSVGPDFEDRMIRTKSTEPQANTQGNIVQFPNPPGEQGAMRTEWGKARAILSEANPARYQAWFAPLVRDRIDGDILVLRAPSGFHARYVETHLIGDLTRAVVQADACVASVAVID